MGDVEPENREQPLLFVAGGEDALGDVSAATWFGAGLSTLFQIVALAAVSYGLLTAAGVLGGAWGQRPANQSLAQIGPAE